MRVIAALLTVMLCVVIDAHPPGWSGFPAALALAAMVLVALWLFGAARRSAVPSDVGIVDGSNVMYWGDGQPDLGTVKAVVTMLRARGLRPVVWFDANAGYLVDGRYLQPKHLAWRSGLPTRAVRVAPKGTPADPLILAEARARAARVVSNDRFRDWAADYPEVVRPGYLMSARPGRDGGAPLLH